MKISDQGRTAVAQPAVTTDVQRRTGYFRWSVCALLFFAATVNYIDRQVIGILKPTLQDLYHWSEIDYSNIVFAFTAAYAIGLLLVGRIIDLLGVRKGFSLAVIVWSIAAMGHAMARSVLGFGAARFALGLGESGSFPASIKAVAEWFPKKERALATGIFNSGTNIGAVVAPLVVPWITVTYGWQWAFIATGALGFIWIIAWLASYTSPQKHPRISQAELAHIESDPRESEMRTGWQELIPHRQTWAFAAGKFLTDPIWWVYLYWVPDFLHKNHGLSLTEIGPPVVTIYILADIGSIGGGWLSSSLIKNALDRQCQPQTCNAGLRCVGGADRVCVSRIGSLDCVSFDWAGRRGPSGLVRQFVYLGFRHVSAARGWIGGRHWWNGRSGWRDADRQSRRLPSAVDGFVLAGVYHRGIGVPHRTIGHSSDRPADGASGMLKVRERR